MNIVWMCLQLLDEAGEGIRMSEKGMNEGEVGFMKGCRLMIQKAFMDEKETSLYPLLTRDNYR